MLFDSNAQLSSHYKVKDLTATSKVLSRPNMITTSQEYDNLKLLADTLELMLSKIGPFSIVSGFRTAELQNVLKSEGEPVATGKSYHEIGLGVDIAPTKMPLAEYFGKILADNSLKSRFVEIAIKPSQNTLHLAVRAPDNSRPVRVTGLNNQKVYASLSPSEIAAYAAPYVKSALPVLAVGLVAVLAYMFIPRHERA